MRIQILICAFIVALTACGPAKTKTESAMPVGALGDEYKQSKDATKSKYSGKTLTIKGWTGSVPIIPKTTSETGYLSLAQKGGDMNFMVSCQFAFADKAEFEKITPDQTVTVKGIFEDDMSIALKTCQVVKE